jgi:energy-coupling factor transporter ATP-binding protein EcfA2
MSLLQLDRAEWLDSYFEYNGGEHLVIVEPTGGGKTHLMYQMLQAVMREHPELAPMAFMPKASDPSTAQWARALNLRETPEYPPVRKLFQSKPAGHVLWPKHRMDLGPDARREEVGKVLRAGLDGQYKRGNSISLIDDAHSSATMMGLNSYIEEILVNGRAGGAAAWLALQKPSGTVNSGGITSFAYSSPTHYLFGKDTEARNLKRLTEIGGGIDPAKVESIVRNLRLYRIGPHTVSQKLYIDKRGPYMALIGP